MEVKKVPILFIVFNRPEKTQKVLAQIAKYKPEVIYISSDGPRNNTPNDIEKCRQVKDMIEFGLNWSCTKYSLNHPQNKGCKKAVSEALKWFFKNEPYGIILEDDCFPDVSFFDYAAGLLQRFENDNRIFSISGCNLGHKTNSHDSYFFSTYMNMWGWASWRRVAERVDYELLQWESLSIRSQYYFLLKHIVINQKDFDWGWILYWKDLFDQITSLKTDTWDFQWFYAQFKSKSLTIYPTVNLVYNIGFDSEGTHTKKDEFEFGESLKSAGPLLMPLKHPKLVIVDKKFIEYFIKKVWARYHRQSIMWHLRTTVLYRTLRVYLKGRQSYKQ